MRAIQKCKKCGTKYAEVELPGEEVNRIMLLSATNYLRSLLCPKCGGDAIWVDESGVPLSEEERMKFMQKNATVAVFGLGLMILTAILGYQGLLTLPVLLGILVAGGALYWFWAFKK